MIGNGQCTPTHSTVARDNARSNPVGCWGITQCAGPSSPDTWLACRRGSCQGGAGGGGGGACLAGVAVAAAFEQPVLLEELGELAHAGAELFERVEALHPEDLFLERLQELLDDAVGLGLVGERRQAIEAEVVDLGLVVPRAKAAAAIVAEL